MKSKTPKINSTITKFLSLIISLIFILNVSAIYVMGSAIPESINEFELIWKDGYAEDRVVVVLNNEASLALKNYGVQDFLNIDCQSVDSLTKYWDEQARLAIESIAVQKSGGDNTYNYDEFDLGKYNQILCIKLSSKGKDKVIKAIEKLQALDTVLYAGPDIPYYLDKECNDPELFYGIIDFSKNHNPIGLAEAWDITTGSKSIKVGIIDTGVFGDHEDLKDNINTQLSIDYSDKNASGTAFTDNNGHGTSVAGIIGSKGNNGIGTCGVCWDVDLVSLRAATMYTDEEGNSEEIVYGTGIINALSYAERNGIKIINMSASSYDYDPSVAVAIQSYTGLFVCSAGNELNNNDVVAKYPANFDLSNIIVVGASTSTDDELYVVDEEKSEGSNYGKATVDLFAPTRIKTTDIGTELYCRFGGTSASAPVVAGVAALMLSINPNLTTSQLKDIILRSVDIIPSLGDYCVTGGRINAYKAVRTAQMYQFTANTTYTQLATTDTLYATSHGVLYDFCNECTCRTSDYSCDNCDMCDPCEECHIYLTELHDCEYSSDNLYNHTYSCNYCDYAVVELHDWVLSGSYYVCSQCNKTSTYVPIVGAALPPEKDEELIE